LFWNTCRIKNNITIIIKLKYQEEYPNHIKNSYQNEIHTTVKKINDNNDWCDQKRGKIEFMVIASNIYISQIQQKNLQNKSSQNGKKKIENILDIEQLTYNFMVYLFFCKRNKRNMLFLQRKYSNVNQTENRIILQFK